MPQRRQSVVTRLRRQAEKGKLSDDVAIVYRLRGGTREDGVDESVALTAPGSLHMRVRDPLAARGAERGATPTPRQGRGKESGQVGEGEARDEIGREAALDLARLLLDGVESMVPESEARFVPDSLIGSVSLSVGGQTETYYFLADEEAMRHRREPIQPEIRKILQRFRQERARRLPALTPSPKPAKGSSGARGAGKEKK